MDVKKIRESYGLTQEEFAHKIGVTGATIHRWEAGKAKPHKFFLRVLARMEKKSDEDIPA